MTVNWKIGGKAGEGIAATSFMMSKLAQRHGLTVFEYSEYPSLIRGGHTTGQVVASTTPLTSHRKTIDFLVALNEDTIRLHLDEITPTTRIILDPDDDKIDWKRYPSIAVSQVVPVPLVALARQATGKSLASDVVALAASCALIGFSLDIFTTILTEFFAKKGQEVIAENIKAAQAGYIHITQQGLQAPPIVPTETSSILISGTDAIGMGALSAGIQFYSAYPMTPASNLMHFMAAAQEHYPVVVKHTEDEIAAINEALGASYAGVRAMTGSAGGGFALMVEAVSLAGVTELPLVVLVGGRPGPATGLPTWTSQTDLSFVLSAGHGEFPRIVFSPGTVDECFKVTRLAFLLCEKYHTQAYIIADKYLLESRMTTTAFPTTYTNQRYSQVQDPLPEDDSYRRFALSNEGYSPRSLPGQAHGLQLTNSYEHDEYGYATEDATMTTAMVEKRLRKWTGILAEVPAPLLLGPTEATCTLVCWGSTRLVVEDVIRTLQAERPGSVNAIHCVTMLPFPTQAFTTLASGTKRLVMIEENALHQGAQHIRSQTGITIADHINRYDGRPFVYEELLSQVRAML